jgi:hypothetical protein
MNKRPLAPAKLAMGLQEDGQGSGSGRKGPSGAYGMPLGLLVASHPYQKSGSMIDLTNTSKLRTSKLLLRL